MPTYEYACGACGHEWEEVQRITAPPIEVCPKCAKSSAHRLISGGTNFILKGGGWYSDLYASPSATGKKSDANGTSSSDGGNKAEPKADTKADAKPAASGATAAATSTSSTTTTTTTT
jgi:putative FmdB family regulatory protein